MKILFVALSVFFTAFMLPLESYAGLCEKKFYSTEKAYLDADVIFLGAVVSVDDNDYLFEVDEFYKNTEDFKANKTLTLNSSRSGAIFFTENFDYIVFAQDISDENEKKLRALPCSKTNNDPHSYLKYLREQRDRNPTDFNENTPYLSPLTFIGKVVNVEHSLRETPLITKVNSVIDFEVKEVIKDKTDQMFSLQQKVIHIDKAGWCAEGYRVGEEYIVRASPYPLKPSKRTEKHKYGLKLFCLPQSPENIEMRKILKKLSD